MAVITLSRQYGSGGDEIALEVAERLGFRYLDKRLLAEIAAEVSFTEVQMVDFSEDTYQRRNFLERLFNRPIPTGAELRIWREDLTGARVQEVERLDQEQVLALIQSVILAVYNRDNYIIVGRGGQTILQDKPGALHVRIEAPVEMRVQRIMASHNLEENEARALVSQRDRAALEYLKQFYGIHPSDPMLYHLILNTHHLKIRTAVDVICTAVAQAEGVRV